MIESRFRLVEVIMILGMTTFTFARVLVSLIGIFAGYVLVCGLLAAKRLDGAVSSH